MSSRLCSCLHSLVALLCFNRLQIHIYFNQFKNKNPKQLLLVVALGSLMCVHHRRERGWVV